LEYVPDTSEPEGDVGGEKEEEEEEEKEVVKKGMYSFSLPSFLISNVTLASEKGKPKLKAKGKKPEKGEVEAGSSNRRKPKKQDVASGRYLS
jgi:hypothetical protein